MRTRNELLKARRDAEHASAVLAAVEALPSRKGSLVTWQNGVVWRRLGDDEWEPLHRDNRYVRESDTYGVFSSAHVASSAGLFLPVVRLKRLPRLDPEEKK